jgi:hypothetical protein
MSPDTPDPRIDKHKVTMRNFITTVDEEGQPQIHTHEASDYVPPDILDAYVADARTRWQSVTVSEEPDAGPGGYEGDTNIPVQLEGRDASYFQRYGDASTPDNALDEITGKQV